MAADTIDPLERLKRLFYALVKAFLRDFQILVVIIAILFLALIAVLSFFIF